MPKGYDDLESKVRKFRSEYYGMSLTGLITSGLSAMAAGLIRLPSLNPLENAIGFDYTTSWFTKLIQTTIIRNITFPEAAALYFIIGPVIACEAFLYMLKTPILKKFRN